MGGFFGKGSGIDPLGITTSKYADPLGINRKIGGTLDKIDPLTETRRKNARFLDPLAISDDGAAAKGLEPRKVQSIASQNLLGD